VCSQVGWHSSRNRQALSHSGCRIVRLIAGVIRARSRPTSDGRKPKRRSSAKLPLARPGSTKLERWNPKQFDYYTVLCNSVAVRALTCTDPIASVTGKPAIQTRPLLGSDQASEVVTLFKVLANESRLRILHALTRTNELCVSDIAETVGMSAQAVSNQLRRLVDRRVVATRRNGNYIVYRLIDPCVPGLLGLGWCLAEETGRLVSSTTAAPTSKAKVPRTAGGRRRKR
jgi:ArsR family transcriptional regulator, lead/cadmium/zinc/bismuth-responsive transcriptional repressor